MPKVISLDRSPRGPAAKRPAVYSQARVATPSQGRRAAGHMPIATRHTTPTHSVAQSVRIATPHRIAAKGKGLRGGVHSAKSSDIALCLQSFFELGKSLQMTFD
ncbi:hypothetical protein KIPB_013735, partial [Kipferlia bialata]|eukprot:g13735.t1